MTTTVKHFHSAMPGAPTLNGVAGSLIAVLDACLVDGFGLKSADSVVVSGGIATVTFSTGHSFEPDVIALVAGATPADLNGEKRVLTTSTNTITFDATDIADGTATGTITIKIAPAGWAKPFSGTNLAAYRSTDVTGTRMFLRVADGTTTARVVGYESMSDVNTGVSAFPSEAVLNGGGYWGKSTANTSAGRAWTLVSDSVGFWLHVHPGADTGASGSVWGFGDFLSYKAGDPYRCALWCGSSSTGVLTTTNTTSPNGAELVVGSTVGGSVYAPRSFTGLGGGVAMGRITESYFTSNGYSGSVSQVSVPAYPNGPNNGLFMTRHLLVEIGVCLRGASRGVLLVPQLVRDMFDWRSKVDGQGSLAGRKLLAIKTGYPGAAGPQGVLFFDITGPWE